MAQSRQSFTVKDADHLAEPEPDQEPVFYTHLMCPYAQRSLLCFLQKVAPFMHLNAAWGLQYCRMNLSMSVIDHDLVSTTLH